MNTGKAVYGILSTNSGVTDLVSTRIFPEIAEQEAATPFIVYQLQSVAPEDTHDGPSKLDEVRFEFICYADTYDQAADVGVKVRAALDRVSGTYNGVNVESVQFNDVDINIEYDPRRYSQVLTFTFRIKRDDITIALGTPVTGAQLGDLSDVNVTGVSNGQVIAYNNTSGNWEASSAGGGASSLNDLSDVTVSSPTNFDILLSNGSGAYANSSVFNDIYTNIKTGSSTSFSDGANSNSEMALTATTAKLKTGVTEVVLTETSPGDIEFVVATDASGSTAFTAIHLDGTTTASEANLVIKQGAALAIEGNSSALAKFRNTNSGNTLLTVPASTGTLALTSDIASDSAVVANTAKTSFPGFGTSAGTALEGDTALLQLGTSGTTALAGDTTTISTAQANAITANTAKVSYTDAAAVAANTAKTSFPGFGTSAGTALEGDTALLQLGTSSTTALAGDTTTITTDQANAITANTAKNTYPSADASKLAGIETAADVTDATNVAAAGSLMASSAQLTGNLDTQANEINTTTSNGNVKVAANGTGLLEVRGNVGGGSDDNPGAIKLNCAQNSHGITIKSPPHANGASYTLTLPDNDGDANQVLKTDGSGNLSWTAQTGGSGGGMTETPLMTVTGRATFSSSDDNESVVLGGVYGVANYFQHSEELGDYDASAVIDSTTFSQSPFKHIYTAIHLPSDSKKVRAKISYRIDDPETSQTWGFSMWSANNPSGTSSYDMTLRGRSTDTTPASTSSVYVYNKEFTTTSAITDDAIYFVIDHRTGSISATTYIYFTLTLFLVD
jgi:hypothetical protein